MLCGGMGAFVYDIYLSLKCSFSGNNPPNAGVAFVTIHCYMLRDKQDVDIAHFFSTVRAFILQEIAEILYMYCIECHCVWWLVEFISPSLLSCIEILLLIRSKLRVVEADVIDSE